MAKLHDDALDGALNVIKTNANALYICSAEPSTYTEATSTYALGSKTSPTLGAIGDATGGGRKFTMSAITDGSVTGTGTASHWALVDTLNSKLMCAQALGVSQSVTTGNQFTTDATDIRMPDVV